MRKYTIQSVIILYLYISGTSSQLVDFMNVTTKEINLVNATNIDGVGQTEFICMGSLQLSALDDSKLLLGLCSPPSLDLSGAIGTLKLDDVFSSTDNSVTILYGNISAPDPISASTETEWDGDNTTGQIVRPEHFYQTKDSILYFVDARSCLRSVDYNMNMVTTVKGICGNGTLSIEGFDHGLIYGMTYMEEKEMFVFAILNKGIYLMSSDGSVGPRLIVDRDDMSHIVSDEVRQIVRGGGDNQVVWHKIRSGVNMYNLSKVENATDVGGNVTYQDTFIRYISATGSNTIDTTAVRSVESDPELGTSDALLDVSPDGKTLLIADAGEDRLFFMEIISDVEINSQIEPLEAYCSKANSIVDGSSDNCTFHAIAAALWLDESMILVYERYAGAFRIVELNFTATPITVTTTTTATTTTTLSTMTTTNNGLSDGEIAAIVVCAIVVVTACIATATAVILHRHNNNQINCANPSDEEGDHQQSPDRSLDAEKERKEEHETDTQKTTINNDQKSQKKKEEKST